jgi:ParB family chromosome partitioning protein
VDDKDILKELAKRIPEEEITVRALEKIVKELGAGKKEKLPSKLPDSYFKEMEISLRQNLGRKVQVKSRSGDKGTLVLEFYNKDDLRELAEKLAKY